MKIKYLLIVSLFVSTCWSNVEAQTNDDNKNQVNINVQLRPRAEYRNGSFYPLGDNDKSAGFVNQRSRISLDYQREGLSALVSLQNVNLWGADALANRNANTMVNEAWAQIKTSEGFFAKFGRQVLNYNDGRIFGGLDWNQSGYFHDALKMGYVSKAHQLDLVFAYNQSQERVSGGTYFAGGVPYKTMQMLNYQYNEMASFTPSFLFANIGYEVGVMGASEVAHLQTIGTNLIFNPIADLRLQATAYYQMGERGAVRQQVSAGMVALRADYKIDNAFKVFGGFDYLSGNNHNDAEYEGKKYNAFNTLFATNHAFYGAMDVFIANPYVNGMALGLFDKYIGGSYSPNAKSQFLARIHHFSMAADAYYTLPPNRDKVGKGMATELDLQFDYSVMKDVRFTCGYSVMFGNDNLKFAKGGNPDLWQDWAFISINVNPRVFSSKW